MGMDLLAAIFERARIALCLVDQDDRVAMVNDAWLRFAGLRAEQVVGRRLPELLPEARELEAALDSPVRIRTGGSVDSQRQMLRVRDRESWWEGGAAPVPMEGGTGALIWAREVTTRVLWEQERERLLQELKDVNWQLVLATMRHKQLAAAAEAGHRRVTTVLEGLISYDCRSPLTAIRSLAQLIQRSPDRVELVARAVDSISDNVAQLESVIRKLLEESCRSPEGAPRAEPRPQLEQLRLPNGADPIEAG